MAVYTVQFNDMYLFIVFLSSILASCSPLEQVDQFYDKLRDQVIEEYNQKDENLPQKLQEKVGDTNELDDVAYNTIPEKKNTFPWPMGAILYYLDTNSYDAALAAVIRKEMTRLESEACVKFVPLREPPAQALTWLHITNPEKVLDCVHAVTDNGLGERGVTLGYSCLQPRQVVHALMHGIGFNDEVRHPQRDHHVRILWDNIQPAYRHLFRVDAELTTGGFVDYDTQSVMHFHDRAYSINGRPTIVPLVRGAEIAPSTTLSQLDRLKLQLYFGQECNRREVHGLLKQCKNVLKQGHNGSS